MEQLLLQELKSLPLAAKGSLKVRRAGVDCDLSVAEDEHLAVDGTLAVDFFCQSSCITHSQYGAQLTKDAVVDQFREDTGARPGVDRAEPDIRINVYLFKNRARISLDMAGSSLHRRNYRKLGAEAPLKENLAACMRQ